MITIRPRLQLGHPAAGCGEDACDSAMTLRRAANSSPRFMACIAKISVPNMRKQVDELAVSFFQRTRLIPRSARNRERSRKPRIAWCRCEASDSRFAGSGCCAAPMSSENAATLFLDVETKEIVPDGLGDNSWAVACGTGQPCPGCAEAVPNRRLGDEPGGVVQLNDCGLPLITMFPMATKRSSP